MGRLGCRFRNSKRDMGHPFSDFVTTQVNQVNVHVYARHK